MEWVKLIVELIRILIWPGVVIMLGLTFKDDLKKLIPRILKAGPTGVEFDAQKQVVASTFTGELREIPGVVRTNTIAALEKKIHGELQVFNPEAHVDLLVRHLAQAQLQTAFERIYGIMFGSQIAGLRALVDAGGTVSRLDGVRFFNEQVESRPDLKNLRSNFDEWLRYLIRSGLVVDDGTKLSITDFGRDFLLYLASTHGNEAKAA